MSSGIWNPCAAWKWPLPAAIMSMPIQASLLGRKALILVVQGKRKAQATARRGNEGRELTQTQGPQQSVPRNAASQRRVTDCWRTKLVCKCSLWWLNNGEGRRRIVVKLPF